MEESEKGKGVSRKVKKMRREGCMRVPCWNIGKNSRLLTIEEKKEWVENILPPGARTKFEIYEGCELGSRIDHALYETVGLLTRVRSEIGSQGSLNGKLKQGVNRLQNAQTVNAERVRKLEIEKVALEMDKEVLEKEKEELQGQVLAAGKLGSGGAEACQLREVAEFWANLGAKIMVRNAMCSPEMKEWLLTFTTKCTDIGYTEGVTAVFAANQQKEEAAEFPYYGEGDLDGPTFIDGQIAELQTGVIDFEFLRYMEANPGLSSQDLATVFEQVYPEVEPGVNDPTEEVP